MADTEKAYMLDKWLSLSLKGDEYGFESHATSEKM
jgi:hypothetical protein